MENLTITITECKRIGKSQSGNPIYDLTTDTGRVYRTGVDTNDSYAIVDGRIGEAAITVDGPRNRVVGFEYL